MYVYIATCTSGIININGPLSQTVHIQRGHEYTRTGNWSRGRGGLVERVRVRRYCGPLCSKLVAFPQVMRRRAEAMHAEASAALLER